MDVQSEIERIEKEAREARLPINDLCKAGRINRATWQRWKFGKTSPTIETWNKFQQGVARLLKRAA